jgi:hypothetical protein
MKDSAEPTNPRRFGQANSCKPSSVPVMSITAVIVGIAFVDMFFVSKNLRDVGDFVFRLVVLAILGAFGGTMFVRMMFSRIEREDPSTPASEDRRWVWLVPLAIILCGSPAESVGAQTKEEYALRERIASWDTLRSRWSYDASSVPGVPQDAYPDDPQSSRKVQVV